MKADVYVNVKSGIVSMSIWMPMLISGNAFDILLTDTVGVIAREKWDFVEKHGRAIVLELSDLTFVYYTSEMDRSDIQFDCQAPIPMKVLDR